MLIHSNFENKYKLFLDIFIYVNIQEISAQTLLTLSINFVKTKIFINHNQLLQHG